MSNDQQITTINTVKAGRDAWQFNIQGDYYEHRPRDGWVVLSEQINPNALPDAASRLSAKCHPGTREAILQLITMWMEGQTMPSRKVLWLHGSVGLGKSAIAESIAYNGHDPSVGQYTASYFFPPRQEMQASSAHLFIKTIVYQLGLRIPNYKKHIVDSLTEDPVLLSKNIEPLLEALIINPVISLRSSFPELSPVIVIDGLDQCASKEVQMDIVQKVIGALRNHPFRFLVTSRPEQHLREVFNKPTLAVVTETISLDRYPGTDDDIRFFLQDGFADILHRRIDMRHVPEPWPTPSDLNYLVSKASGQFLYATTVLQYVDASEDLPTDQLKTLTSPVGHSFSNLDGLYIAILNTCPESKKALLQRVLTMMNILHCPQSPEVYEDLLGARRGHVTVSLGNMHSLIRFPNFAENEEERTHYHGRAEYDHTQGLRLRHENFRDFLEVPARSGQYSLEVRKESDALIGFVVQDLFLKFITDGHPAEDTVAPCRETWGYLKEHLHMHLLNSEPDVLQSALDGLEETFHVIGGKENTLGSAVPIPTFHALSTLLTTISKMVRRHEVKVEKRRNLSADHSRWAVDVVLTKGDLLEQGMDTFEDRLRQLYRKFSSLLDKLYFYVLRSSPDLCKHLSALLVSCKKAIPVQWLQDMFGDSISALWRVPNATRDAVIHQWDSPLWARYSSIAGATTDVIALNAHFTAFMLDPGRCGQFYQFPEKVQAIAFRQILRRVFSSAWLLGSRSSEAISCLDKILKSVLAPTSFDLSSYSADDPRMLALNDLVSMDYCVSYISSSPAPNVTSSWQTMLKILRWLYDQRQQARKLPNEDLAKLFQDASDNIYRQILSVEGANVPGYSTVTVIKSILDVVASDHSPISRRQSDAGDPNVDASTTPKTIRALPSVPSDNSPQNHVTDTLLLLYGVRHSLDSFLKSRERAGALHVQANKYHTQLAEICLELCRSSLGPIGDDDRSEDATHDDAAHASADWRTPIAQRAWGYHLERAQPTTRLLSLLRSIQSGDWLAGGSLHQGSKDKGKAKIRSVGIITRWLKDLAKQPADLVQRWENIGDELAQRKGGSLILQRKTAINPMRSSSSSFV